HFSKVIQWILRAREISAVISSYNAQQLYFNTCLLQRQFHRLSVLEWHDFVRISVHQKKGSGISGYVIQSRCLPVGLVFNRSSRKQLSSDFNSHSQEVNRLDGSKVNQIDWSSASLRWGSQFLPPSRALLNRPESFMHCTTYETLTQRRVRPLTGGRGSSC